MVDIADSATIREALDLSVQWDDLAYRFWAKGR